MADSRRQVRGALPAGVGSTVHKRVAVPLLLARGHAVCTRTLQAQLQEYNREHRSRGTQAHRFHDKR